MHAEIVCKEYVAPRISGKRRGIEALRTRGMYDKRRSTKAAHKSERAYGHNRLVG